MFGYVKVYQPELKMGEFEHYRGVYCALCKQLGRRYGFLARMTLSYDFTFLALFYMALSDDCPGFKRERCAFNPLKKRTCCCDSPALEDAADAAALLVYYKTRDTIADSGFWKGLMARCLLPFAASGRKKAAREKPEMEAVMADSMRRQAELERAGTLSIDAAAEPTARMLAYLAGLAGRDEREKRILDRFGYCLGRWIYLIDAIDDIDENYFGSTLMSANLPDVDLMVRTSGEQRLSNFMLWQLAYAEFIFTPVCWPDFDEKELHKAIWLYQNRERRYGGLK